MGRQAMADPSDSRSVQPEPVERHGPLDELIWSGPPPFVEPTRLLPEDRSFPNAQLNASPSAVDAGGRASNYSAEAEPSIEVLWAFLEGPHIRQSDGAVLSWANASHTGYPYPEAAGLCLSMGSRLSFASKEALQSIARRLLKDVSESGGVGRDGALYLFDSAMVLKGLLDWQEVSGTSEAIERSHRIIDFIGQLIDHRRAVLGGPGPGRWSTEFGCHLLKVATALTLFDDLWGEPRVERWIESLTDRLFPLYESGRFFSFDGTTQSYTHGNCYAFEGLLHLKECGYPVKREWVTEGAARLARMQREDGTLPAFMGDSSGYGPGHADATAQSVRIWSAVDPSGFRYNIRRALHALTGLVGPRGGIRYRVDSNDENSWSTAFTIQAVRWSQSTCRPKFDIV